MTLRAGIRGLSFALALSASVAQSPLLTYLAPAQTPTVRQDLRPAFTIYEWSGEYPSFVANPTNVAIWNDEIYVLDTGNKRVAVFDRSGRFVRAFGRAGQGPGELGLGGGNSGQPGLAVEDGRVYVADRPQRRVHVFDSDGEVVGSYVPAEGRLAISNMAVSACKVYLYMSGSGESGGEIFVFEAGVEGGAVFSEPMIAPRLRAASSDDVNRSGAPAPTGLATASRFNQSKIAVAADGRVMQAYWWWPLLRLHRPGSITDARFVDDSWWAGRGMEAYVPNVRTWFEQARETGAPSGFSRRPFFFDVEYIAGTDSWVTLSNGNYVELFDDDRRLVRQFHLLPPEGEEDFAVVDIGVDDQRELLCGADPQLGSEVVCYLLPPFE